MIIIIPGIFGKKEYYNFLANKLREAGFVTEIADLGYNTKGIKSASEAVRRYLTRIPEKYDIIAHSLGGIILKYIIDLYPETKNHISSVIFVSVPHEGSWVGLLFALFRSGRELLPWRKEIKQLSKVLLLKETTNFIAQSDLLIWPRKSNFLKGYTNIVISGTNHSDIINNEDFVSKAVEFIKSGHNKIFL